MKRHTSILALFCLCAVVAGTSVSKQKVTFSQLSVCPSPASLSQLSKLEGAQHLTTCHVACASRPNCSMLHRTGGICFFGDSNQRSSHFTLTASPGADPCVSYSKDDNIKSKLIVAFDFRLGYTNLANPGMFDATPQGGVTRDAQGAHFPGAVTDFIEVDTQGGSLISKYLDHPSNFSFFAKVIRQYQYQNCYHSIYNGASDDLGSPMCFGDRDRRAWVQHNFFSLSGSSHNQRVETRQSSQILPNNLPSAISLGAVFHGNTLSNFYFNGSHLATENDQAWGSPNEPLKLRLGYDLKNAKTLQGRMICYMIAKAALSTAEFHQLEQLCPW